MPDEVTPHVPHVQPTARQVAQQEYANACADAGASQVRVNLAHKKLEDEIAKEVEAAKVKT